MWHLRAARPDEADALTNLAIRAKASWGYDAAFMAACLADLTLTPSEIAARPTFVADEAGRMLGFYDLAPVADGADLVHLFVEPAAQGRGVGAALFRHAVAEALQAGFPALLIESDPNAVGFYEALGAVRIGEVASPVDATRRLPLLRIETGA